MERHYFSNLQELVYKMTVGRPRKQEEKRLDRKLTLTDEVFNGLKKMGNGSASQAVTDLYNERINDVTNKIPK